VRKKQTRKSISYSRELYLRASEFAASKGVSMSQLAARGLRAVLDGEVEIGTLPSPDEVQRATVEARAVLTLAEVEARCAARDLERKAIAERARLLRERQTAAKAVPWTPVRLAPTPRDVKPVCALCVEPIAGDPILAPLGRDGAIVKVCMDCETTTPKERDHLFGARSHGIGSDGVGEGNRRVGRVAR